MEHKFVDVFEKHFPRVCEKPGIQPYKEEIHSIVMNVVNDIVNKNDSTWSLYKKQFYSKDKIKSLTEMPYHEEL